MLLLVVLSLLAVFAMIAVTFVVIANLGEGEAKQAAKMETEGDAPSDLADRAIYELLRGPALTGSGPRSALFGHDLLQDLYGNDGFTGTITDVRLNTQQQFVDLEVTLTPGLTTSLSQIDNYYNGCVLTFVSGQAKGVSVRIVGYTWDATNGAIFTTMTPASESNGALPTASDRIVVNGRPFNGTGAGLNRGAAVDEPMLSLNEPFGNTPEGPDGFFGVLGVDDDRNGTVDDATEVGLGPLGDDVFIPSLALLPNRTALSSIPLAYSLGGLDESYDAPDYQNMALAYLPVDAGETSPFGVDISPSLIPSFHRPALFNYWYHKLEAPTGGIINWPPGATAEDRWLTILQPYGADGDRSTPDGPLNDLAISDTIVALKRRISLRPLQEDHPNFTGSNASRNLDLQQLVNTVPLTATHLQNGNVDRVGPWDVDNDGDAVRDSVWIDLGYPIQRTRDGRIYKPLFAYLVVDLDGRLNLNAHGNSFDRKVSAGANPIASPTPPTTNVTENNPIPRQLADGTSSTDNLPRGQGYGTAEISLGPLLANYYGVERSRYGSDRWPGGVTGTVDMLARIQFSDAPDRADGTDLAPQRKAFGSLPNLHGTYGVGLDARGLPVSEVHANALLRTDTPYELNLSRKGARDSSVAADTPFTIYELEELYRPYDADAVVLDNRLDFLQKGAGLLPANPGFARLLTTESWSLPVPAIVTTRELRADTALSDNLRFSPKSILDILRARIEKALATATPAIPVNDATVNAVMHGSQGPIGALPAQPGILSPNLKMGLRMDVNRPFGNGKDDDNVADPGYGVVDEPDEPGGNPLWGSTPLAGANFTPYDANADGTINGTDYQLQRQLYARHLYVLMMALTDEGYILPTEPPPAEASTLSDEQRKARRIAQWAINVVDFRDPDAIMTPFEYDVNPFDGWDVDGDILTTNDWDAGTPQNQANHTGGIVWGCERPELIMTETIAWHDVRTEDLAMPSNLTTSVGSPDPNFDQRLRPRGRAFIELYNPNPTTSIPPAEFYGTEAGVVLDGLAVTSPIWRLLIVKGESNNEERDPDAIPNLAGNPFNPADIERSVYFVDPAGLPNNINHGKPYYTTADIAPVLPGRYALVGSAGDGVAEGNSTGASRAGDLTAGPPNTTAQRIVLSPSPNPNNMQVDVRDTSDTSLIPAAAEPIVAVAIDSTLDGTGAFELRNFSISEPVDGYPVTAGGSTWDGTLGDEGGYAVGGIATPIDEPLDDSRTDPDPLDIGVFNTSNTTENYRTVHLQRLANPLIDWNPESYLPDGTANPDHDPSLPVNPYRTIDTMSINLTVFNGLSNSFNAASNNVGNQFSALQRGENNDAAGQMNLWKHEPPEMLGATAGMGANHYFNFDLDNTLGYLNAAFGGSASVNFPAPETPFPWLTWNNRPFVSQYEMMLVPASSSSRLFYEFAMQPTAGTADPYNSWTGTSPQEFENYRAPFNHLLNFFQTANAKASDPSVSGDLASHHYRLFDYTYVPSRFVGMETLLNPNSTTGFGQDTDTGTPGLQPVNANFVPPFNKVSNYREPGRVNLNTMVGSQVWEGIMHGDPSTSGTPTSRAHPGPTWNDLVDSRRGYNGGAALELNPDSPTFFANPFRAAGAGELVPTESLMRSDVETTLLRTDVPGDLLARQTPSDTPLFEGNATDDYNNADRNPYFAYQPMMRLGNLVTTQSNVYAVWVTVGFFEVEENPLGVTQVHPDGYRLAKELGSDTGEVKRHRSFYIIDRSIPVGFEPGENHNVDKAILLRRFLE